MSIEKRGDEYYAAFQVRGQRYHPCLHTGNEAVALRLEREMKASIKARAAGRIATGTTWQSFKAAYLSWATTKNPRTVAIERRALAYLEGYSLINRVEDVAPALLDGLKAHLKAEGKGIVGINRTVRACKFVMRWSERNRYCAKQEWSEVKKFREPKGRLDFLPVDELSTLFKFAAKYPHHLTLAMLCSRAGLRASEAYWLQWRDVDLVRGRINIVSTADFTVKNYETRFIPIPADLLAHLKAIKPAAKTPFVIADGAWRPASVESMATEFRDQVMKPAGFADRGRLHILRHTYASHLAMAGIDPWRLQKLMGHANISTTEIYAHLMPNSLDSSASLLPEIPK